MSTNKEKLFKLNFDYLIENNDKKELQTLCRSLGETNVSGNKTFITNKILNNSKYIWKTKNKISKIIKKRKNDKKIEYYKNLKIRLYSNIIYKENKNYVKPCMEFIDNDSIGITILNEKQLCLKYRLSYALSKNIFIEDIPLTNDTGDILEICHGHGCKKNCIEPTHLSLKTKKENNYEDKIRDGTINRGDSSFRSTITEELALKIKHSKGEGTQKERAEKFEVKISIIKSIDQNLNWFYIPDKEGNINNETKRNKEKDKETCDKNKKREFTEKEWQEALKILKIKSIEKSCKNNKLSNCLIYQGSKDKDGYGKITFKCINYRTHVLAWEAKNNKKRDKNMKLVIRHICNEKSCCNPEHLESGTLRENALDYIKYSKKVKLKEDEVKKIKKILLEGKLTHKVIADRYKVAPNTISRINTGKTWSHIII